jgi:hypothetical protein
LPYDKEEVVMMISKEQLESKHLFEAGVKHMTEVLDLDGIIVIDGLQLTSIEMVDFIKIHDMQNLCLTLLVDPDKAQEDLRVLIGLVVRDFCTDWPRTAIKCALLQGFTTQHNRVKDRVDLGLSPSTVIEEFGGEPT